MIDEIYDRHYREARSELNAFVAGMFASLGRAPGRASIAFVSAASIESGVAASYRLAKRVEAVRGCRALGKKDMRLNDTTPKITVDPETYAVTADGVRLTCEPAKVLPLAQKFFLF